MDTNERMRRVEAELVSRFGKGGPVAFFRSPGRVDVMGSHTDYNQGFILACTVDRDIIAAARLRDDGAVNLYSLNTEPEVRTHRDRLVYRSEHGWANYVKGVIKELLDLKVPLPGLDMVVHGVIPVGGNLSSSAALEAVTCEAVLGLGGADLPRWDRVRACQSAENNFVGLPCGIMDQFSVFMGQKNKALLLDCRDLTFREIPFHPERSVLVVIDSGLGRSLVASKYKERVKECQKAVRVLRRGNKKIKALRDASARELAQKKAELGETVFRRARHVISENRRVKQAARAMESRGLDALGKIMEQGYKSCRDDYENSIPELDRLHDLATVLPGVYGVRICGAGWGGCLLALVQKKRAAQFQEGILTKYAEQSGRQAKCWVVEPSNGAGPLR